MSLYKIGASTSSSGYRHHPRRYITRLVVTKHHNYKGQVYYAGRLYGRPGATPAFLHIPTSDPRSGRPAMNAKEAVRNARSFARRLKRNAGLREFVMGASHVGRNPEHKTYLNKVRLNGGGYDEDGRYFGNVYGTAVYRWHSEHYDHHGHVRATSRAAAKADILRHHPFLWFAH